MNKKLLPLVYAMLALFIFMAQSYYLYFEFLPVNLAAYASAPDIQGHIKKMLDVMFGPAIFWFVLLEASIVGYAIVMYVKARRGKLGSESEGSPHI